MTNYISSTVSKLRPLAFNNRSQLWVCLKINKAHKFDDSSSVSLLKLQFSGIYAPFSDKPTSLSKAGAIRLIHAGWIFIGPQSRMVDDCAQLDATRVWNLMQLEFGMCFDVYIPKSRIILI